MGLYNGVFFFAIITFVMAFFKFIFYKNANNLACHFCLVGRFKIPATGKTSDVANSLFISYIF